jgi:hypothetical protein
MPVDLLITGKIRDAQISELVIQSYIPLIHSKVFRKAIFSGWEDDRIKYPDFFEFLEKSGIEFRSCGFGSHVRSHWNFWEQLLTLEYGLNAIEDDVYVFKSRCDLFIPDAINAIPLLLKLNKEITCNAFGIKNKIWIPSFVPAQPFFLADQCYFGLSQDLRKFLNYDASYEVKNVNIPLYPGSETHPSAAATESRFWSSVFLHQFPILREYLEVLPYSMNGYSHYNDLERFQLENNFYQEYLSIYWYIVSQVFRVSSLQFYLCHSLDPKGNLVIRAKSHDFEAKNFMKDVFTENKNYPTSISKDYGFQKFVRGEDDNEYYSKYQKALRRALNYSKSRDRKYKFSLYLAELSKIAKIR